MDAPSIERVIDIDEHLPLPADELWRLIGTAEGWSEWLVDEADIVVGAGARGVVVDDGVSRGVRVEAVEHGARITFVWSSDDADTSRVTLQLDEVEGRKVLRITEQPLVACAGCPMRDEARASRWDLRECLLCLAVPCASRV